MEGQADGPTILVTGGVHGDEPAGWHAAHHLTNFNVHSGEVIIIPEVNKEAIKKESHFYSDGNLNRHFPPDEEVESDLAKALWEKVTEVDPDVFIDLHSSKGILMGSDSGIGQAVFHTPNDFRFSLAKRLEQFNAEVIVPSDYGREYYFVRGITKANGSMLYHKLSSEWEIPTYLIETTRKGTDVETRTKWEAQVAYQILELHGVV